MNSGLPSARQHQHGGVASARITRCRTTGSALGRGDASANGTPIVNSGTVIKAGANNLVVGSSGATGALLIVNGGQVCGTTGMLWLGENATANAAACSSMADWFRRCKCVRNNAP